MYRAYVVLAALMVGLLGYAQYNHWSVWGLGATHEPSRLASTGTRGK